MKRSFHLPFTRRRARADVDAEVLFHLEGRIEELMATGLSRGDAEREALRRFGDPARVESEVERIDVDHHRRVAFHEWIGARTHDARLAIRALARRPTYAIAVIVTLGLGMGASTAIYTLLQRVVLDPLPYPAAARLVRLKNPVPAVAADAEWDMAYAQYYHYVKAPAIERIGLYERDAVNVGMGDEPWRARLAVVSVDMFDLLGLRAARGRLFAASEDVPGAPDVALLSWTTWQSRFGGDEGVIGSTLRINERPFEVIGVLAQGAELPPDRGQVFGAYSELWVAKKLNPNGPFFNNHTHPMIARLAPGATIEEAQAQLDELLLQLPAEYPRAYRTDGVGRTKFWTRLYALQPYLIGDAARNLWIAFGAVLLVLIIACANVANLLLVRLETQRREFAVRTALGAERGDIAAEALGEGLVLATGGAFVAVAISVLAFRALTALAPVGIPRLEGVALDWRALAFVALVALGIAVAFAVVAATHYRRGAGFAALGEGGRSSTVGVSRQRVRGALVVTQVALALVLVIGAGLLLRSYDRLRAVHPGINPNGVLTVEWFLPYQRYDSLYKAWRFDQEVLARVRALPNVASAGAADVVPFYDNYGCTVQGFEEQAVLDRLERVHLTTCAGQGIATPGFFETLGIPLVTGRYHADADNDDPSRGAVVVTKAFAERFWPDENPIGKGVGPNGWRQPPFYRVVGVVGDVHGLALDGPPAIGIYYPIMPIVGSFWSANRMRLVVRAKDGNALGLLDAVRRAIREVDPTIPVANAEMVEAAVDRSTARISFTMLLLATAGIVALALAAIGLYGVISYLVVRRTAEIGVRIALGAQTAEVEALVVGGALRLAAIGIVVGLASAAAVSRILTGLLYEIAPWDVASYGGSVAVLALVAAIASWIPARRAARVSPVEALRSD